MNAQEALEIIKNEIDEECHCGYMEDALWTAVQSLEKQIPKKPGVDNDNGIYETEHCPNCNRKLFPNEHHCRCGQALDWGDEK